MSAKISLESQTVSHYFGDLDPQCFCEIITGVSDSELTSGHPNGHLLYRGFPYLLRLEVDIACSAHWK